MLFILRQDCEFARFEQAADKTLDQRFSNMFCLAKSNEKNLA